MASLRLLCFPYAGAGFSAFRGWAERLPAHVEAFAVQLPAREDRLSTAPLVEWPRMFSALLEAVRALPPQATAIFGHSLGAVTGFELARWMHGHAAPPVHLFLSARAWAGLPRDALTPIWQADDDAMLAAMDRRFGSLDTSLSHPEIRAAVLPALRADLQLLDSYRYAAAPPLPCPLTVLAGRDDPSTSPASLSGWQQETTAAFDTVLFDGGHFFNETGRDALVGTIAARLPQAAPAW